MSLAFSTILIFLIIMPGLVARFFYFTYPFSNQARPMELVSEVFWSIVPGFLIHVVYIKLIYILGFSRVSFTDVGFLLLGAGNDSRIDNIFSNLQSHTWQVVLYFLFLLVISMVAGLSIKWIVRHCDLDKRFMFFRFANKWYYILSGQVLQIENSQQRAYSIEFTFVDVLCKIGNETYVYKGKLVSYYLSANGELDGLLLGSPVRKKLQQPGDDYPIEGDFLFLPYKDIVNINLRYFKLDLNTVSKPALKTDPS